MKQLMESVNGFDKVPPHSIEAEMSLLAAMMIDREVLGQVVQIVDREASTRSITRSSSMSS